MAEITLRTPSTTPPPSIYLHIHLPPSISLYLPLPPHPSTCLHLPLPPSISLYLHIHLPASTSLYLPLPPSTSLYLHIHLPAPTSLYLTPFFSPSPSPSHHKEEVSWGRTCSTLASQWTRLGKTGSTLSSGSVSGLQVWSVGGCK